MARKIVIQIVVDNRDAINAIKAQREQQKLLQDQTRFNNEEMRKAERHAKDLTGATEGLSRSWGNLTASIVKGYLIGQGISVIFNGITRTFGALIQETAKLELNFARVAAVTGASKGELADLQATVMGLARETTSSTNDIAEAATELAKLGIAGNELTSVLSGVTRLSNVLGDTLMATGQLVGGVVNTFNLSSEDAAKVADKLFVATGKSASNIEGFKVAFSLAGNVAESAGISFEQLSAAIAALSNQGIRASTIGTGLRNFIGELSKEGSKAQAALGGSIEEMGLLGAMEKLSELKLSSGSLIEIFGKPGSPVAAGLSKATDEYKRFLKEVNSSEGALEKAGSVINETLIGSIARLKNNLLEWFVVMSSPEADSTKSFFSELADSLKRYNEEAAKAKDVRSFFKEQKGLGLDPLEVLGISKLTGTKEQRIEQAAQALKAFREEQKKNAENAGAFNAQLEKQNDQIGKLFDKVSGPPKREIPLDYEALKNEFSSILAQYEKDTFFGIPTSDTKRDSYIRDLDRLAAGFEKLGKDSDAFRVMKEKFKLIEEIDAQQMSYVAGAVITGQAFQEDMPLGTPNDPSSEFSETEFKEQFLKSIPEETKREKYLTWLKETNAELDEYNWRIESTQAGMDALATAADAFGEAIVKTFSDKGNLFENFSDAFNKMMQKMIADLIAAQIQMLIWNTFLKILALLASQGADLGAGSGNGPNDAGATDIPDSGPIAANGLDRTFTKPTRVLVGEAGPERVTVTPFGRDVASNNSGGSGVTIIVQGDVFNAERLVDKVANSNEMLRTRYV